MSDRPRIVCLMTSSLDGGLHPSRYTDSPGGAVKDWTAAYEGLHDSIGAKAWIVGRITMAEMAKGDPHPPADAPAAVRPMLLQNRDAQTFAVAPDRSGKLHFRGAEVGGDHVVVLLGSEVDDVHLAELAADGVSYIVSDDAEIDLAAAVATLRRDLGIETLLLEGGAGLVGSFLTAGLVDELSVVMTPALDGGRDTEHWVAADGGLKGKISLSYLDCTPLAGGALHLRYAVTPAS